MDDMLTQFAAHVTPDNIMGALALLGLLDVRRALRRIENKQNRTERRLNALEDQDRGSYEKSTPKPAHG